VLGQSQSGQQMMDINGLGKGTIQQVFATIPNQHYTLELYYSNNPNPAGAQPSFSAQVQVLGIGSPLVNQALVHAGATTANMNYIQYSANFVANSASTTLILASNQNGTNGVYFDTVSVVPEPSTLALAAVGSLAVLVVGRRCKQRRGSIAAHNRIDT
jgi:hypothetical protein